MFPSSTEDGSIEAGHTTNQPIPNCGFPSSTEDGSIEADSPFGAVTDSVDVFPSSTEDGSIEATALVPSGILCVGFPSSTEDGSIEAAGLPDVLPTVQRVSVLN